MARIYSLRTRKNRPLVTVEVVTSDNVIFEVRGDRNREPHARQRASVRVLAAHLGAVFTDRTAYSLGLVRALRLGEDQHVAVEDLRPGDVVGALRLDDFPDATALTSSLIVMGSLTVGPQSALRTLPSDLQVKSRLDIRESQIRELPKGMRVRRLDLNVLVDRLPPDLVADQIFVPRGSPIRLKWHQLPDHQQRALVSVLRAA
jgi:hypothetical protein